MCEIPEWGINGRIIYVCEIDSKLKKNRIKDVLAVVDRDLGFSMSELLPKTLVYLGIARNQIVGVCVAQPLQQAHRYIHKDGLDCCSTATYPARLWNEQRNIQNAPIDKFKILLSDVAYQGFGWHPPAVASVLHRK